MRHVPLALVEQRVVERTAAREAISRAKEGEITGSQPEVGGRPDRQGSETFPRARSGRIARGDGTGPLSPPSGLSCGWTGRPVAMDSST